MKPCLNFNNLPGTITYSASNYNGTIVTSGLRDFNYSPIFYNNQNKHNNMNMIYRVMNSKPGCSICGN
jgi:hypothetical protein